MTAYPAGEFQNRVLLRYPETGSATDGDHHYKDMAILVLSDTISATVGVILNYPYSPDLSRRILKGLEWPDEGVSVFCGGQTLGDGMHRAKVFHTPDYAAAGTSKVTEGLSVSTVEDVRRDAGRGSGPAKTAIVYGFCIWKPNRVEWEVENGLWGVADYDDGMFFSDEPSTEFWESAWDSHLARETDLLVGSASREAERRVSER